MDSRTRAVMMEIASRMNWLVGYANGLGGDVPPEVVEAVDRLLEVVYGGPEEAP